MLVHYYSFIELRRPLRLDFFFLGIIICSMANNSFRIIGIKAVLPKPEEFPVDAAPYYDKVEAVQKALYHTNRWFYFIKGIKVNENHTEIVMTPQAKRDYSLFDTGDLKINLCAVVGRNGAGKSSMVELLVRTINNLAASLLGEGYNFSAAEHLHFIDYVFADLCFQIGNTLYILESHGRHVTLKFYKARAEHYYVYKAFKEKLILNQNKAEDTDTLLKKHREGRRILKSLFYTMVCNYSLYGFNYRDFLSEATPVKRLEALHIKISDESSKEDTVWLKGIFHKNDGYQTPIVLHPMREDGRLNVVKENALAKERLAALMFYKDSSDNYPFRVINGKLRVLAFSINPTQNRRFSKETMLNVLDISTRRNVSKNYDRVRDCILSFWDEKYGVKRLGLEKVYKDDACDYIVYKTLKIIKNYKKYTSIFSYLSKDKFEYERLKEKLEPLAQDYSHITKKLFQTINYLITRMYSDVEKKYFLEPLEEEMDAEGMTVSFKGRDIRIKQNLLPPPIFDVSLHLSNNDRDNDTIPFSGISSGERQIAYTISNLMYHLVNVDSEWNDNYKKDKDHLEVIKYRYMNVVFDEVELYFHPEMQRQFIGIMMKTLKSVQFTNIRGINIMLVTHSPFVLSDIPDSNVLCLGEGDEAVTKTLGGNIMEMLSRSFFMDNSIGDSIKEDLSSIICLYNKALTEGLDVREEYMARKVRMRYICENLGDDFLKEMITRMVDMIADSVRHN